MSECINEVFDQGGGAVCAKTLKNIELRSENDLLKRKLERAMEYLDYNAQCEYSCKIRKEIEEMK